MFRVVATEITVLVSSTHWVRSKLNSEGSATGTNLGNSLCITHTIGSPRVTAIKAINRVNIFTKGTNLAVRDKIIPKGKKKNK